MPFDYEEWKKAQFSASPTVRQINPAAINPAAIPFPVAITWAGIIWAGMGVFTLLCVLALSAQTGTIRTPGSIVAALLFLYGGVRAVSGTTPGTFRSGVASVILGFIWAISGFTMAGLMTPTAGFRIVLLQALACGMGGGMMLAGFLAVGGNSSYLRWRAAQAAGARAAGR